MDMESSRRSFERLRQLGVKRPFLSEKTDGDGNSTSHGISQRLAAPLTGLVPSRVKSVLRNVERDGSNRVDGYQPQHPHQELVIQYKTALAGLTFNSKPIINNLTIIAGENLQAAKAISSAICSHILEVSSEQKLPSLYLLDSIVKNIGRDYVKYFAARLPEVFCKAYRQVESSIRSSMRHLFGTWKGIFHQQALQMIEKELCFSSPVSGSTSLTTESRPDSQSQQQQRPPHSIHVNPKYLEARLRLQQSSRAKGTSNEIIATGDADRLERSSTIIASKTWADLLPIQMDNIDHPPAQSQASFEKHSFGDKLYSDVSTSPGLGIRRNGLNNEISRHTARSSFNADAQLATKPFIESRSVAPSGNWKNHEVEEYIWDDTKLGLKDHSGAGNIRKDPWTTDVSGKLDFETRPRKQQKVNEHGSKAAVIDSSMDSLSRLQNEPKTTLSRNRNLPSWSIEEPLSMEELNTPILPTPQMKPPPPTDFKPLPQIPTPFKTRLHNEALDKFDPIIQKKHPKPSISLKKPILPESSSPSNVPNALLKGVSDPSNPLPAVSLNSDNDNVRPNSPIPISDLLSSLVVKGLISESPGAQMLIRPPNQIPDVSNVSSLITGMEPESPKLKPNTLEVESLIGFEFKPNVIRESHPSVISSLFHDLKHSCRVCGVRLRLQDQVEKHLEWHDRKREVGSSRKWFVRSGEWVGCCGVDDERMVGADESQCVCVVCGEMFEDVYSLKRDEWMFKDAVFLNVPDEASVIVHPDCVSQAFVRELGLALGIKSEEIGFQ